VLSLNGQEDPMWRLGRLIGLALLSSTAFAGPVGRGAAVARIPAEVTHEQVTLGGHPVTLPMGLQGIGRSGKRMIVAGGTGIGYPNGAVPSAKVFLLDPRTHKVVALPDLQTPRALPLVGASPNGRYVVVAGGYALTHELSQASSVIEMIDQHTGEHVDLLKRYPGLANGLPSTRFAGSVAWVEERDFERIFFIGGSSSFTDGTAGPLGQRPARSLDYYDVRTQGWGTLELSGAYVGGEIALRRLPNGRQEIIVDGRERIDPRTLTVRVGR
jgi:hypothetical protein